MQSEPVDGEICRKCWMKVEMFHVFYQQIKEVQNTMTNLDPLVVDTQFKVDDSSQFAPKDEIKYKRTEDINHIPDIGESYWQNECDGNRSGIVIHNRSTVNCDKKLIIIFLQILRQKV